MKLRIFQDARYEHLITLSKCAMTRVRGEATVVGTVSRGGCVELYSYWQHWQCLFPQHGPGKKHEREIRLVDWQDAVVAAYPRQLLRGLIHSDGCRVVNLVQGRKYGYTRYLFTNRSPDILQIFRAACDLIGVRHRTAKARTVSVARRPDVVRFDAFIGPKS